LTTDNHHWLSLDLFAEECALEARIIIGFAVLLES
jgi:hypothetical protein